MNYKYKYELQFLKAKTYCTEHCLIINVPITIVSRALIYNLSIFKNNIKVYSRDVNAAAMLKGNL